MNQHKKKRGLNRCLRAIALPKNTYYYRLNNQGPCEDDQRLMQHIRAIIREHPDYGYRRILPELEERTGKAVNHKRLRRLLSEHELGLPRRPPVSPPPAVPVRERAHGVSARARSTTRIPVPASV